MNYKRCAICHGLNSMGFCQYTACRFPETESGVINASAYAPKIVTNADRIRGMSDADLAEMMSPIGSGCPPAMRGSRVDCSGQISCYKCWLDWLKQESIS